MNKSKTMTVFKVGDVIRATFKCESRYVNRDRDLSHLTLGGQYIVIKVNRPNLVEARQSIMVLDDRGEELCFWDSDFELVE